MRRSEQSLRAEQELEVHMTEPDSKEKVSPPDEAVIEKNVVRPSDDATDVDLQSKTEVVDLLPSEASVDEYNNVDALSGIAEVAGNADVARCITENADGDIPEAQSGDAFNENAEECADRVVEDVPDVDVEYSVLDSGGAAQEAPASESGAEAGSPEPVADASKAESEAKSQFEDQGEKSQRSTATSELETYFKNLFNDETTKKNTEQVLKTLSDVAARLPGQVGTALKTMREFVQEFTNIKGVQLNLLFFRILDLQIDTMKEADVPINQKLPVGRIEAVHLGRKIHMQVGMGDGNKDLQMNVKEGLSLVINLGFLGKQTIPVKGTARLTRDEKGNLVIAASTKIPGIDYPMTVNIPIKLLVIELRKQSN